MTLGVRQRAGFAAAAGVAIGGVILSAALWFSFREMLIRSTLSAVESEAARLAESADEGIDSHIQAPGPVLFAAILDGGGHLRESRGNDPGGLAASASVRAAIAGTRRSWIERDLCVVAAAPVKSEDRGADATSPAAVVLAVSATNVEDAGRTLALLLSVVIPAAAIVAGFGGFLLAGAALKPVDALTRWAASIDARSLSTRVADPATGDEVERLAKTLNTMLVRIEDAFARNARFVADASHEIRNPLTNLSTEVQSILRRERAAEEYRAAMESMREEIRRLSDIADGLLFLARADAGKGLTARETVDLAGVANATMESLTGAAAARRIDLRQDIRGPVHVKGDVAALARLVRNLAENAIRYTPEGGCVHVRLFTEQDRAVLVVEDSGPGIAIEERLHLFEPFWRGASARVASPAGAGLGLAIAADVAAAHDGLIAVAASDDGGARFEFSLPLFIVS